MKGAKNFAYERNALVELGVIWGIDAVRAFRCHPGAIVSDVHFTYGHHTKPKLVRTRREKDVNRIDCRQSLIEIQLSGFSSMALRSLLVPSTMGQPQPGHVNPPADSKHFLSSLYVLNINSLTKPHAKEQLLALPHRHFHRLRIEV